MKLNNCFKYLVLLFVAFSLNANASESDIPARPSPPQLVNDLAGLLDGSEVAELEQRLEQFSNETSNQIAVVIVPELYGYDKADLAFKIGNSWGVGQKEFNNGIVILVKPKTAGSRGEAFIATGKGIDGAIPDAVAWDIVNHEMIPSFKKRDYYGGINRAVDVLSALAKGEYNYQAYNKRNTDADTRAGIIIAIIFVIIVIILYFRVKSQLRRGVTIGRRGGYYGSGWIGGFGGGGFGGGSSGGGGFGGFGGGSFGGGGAGGSW